MNNGKNLSSFNTARQSRTILDAVAYSYCINCPANYFITLHLNKARINGERTHPFLRTVLKSLGDWYRRNLHRPPIYIWQLENPIYFDEQENRCGGLNIHFLVHIPPRYAKGFRSSFKRWVLLARGSVGKGVFHFRYVVGSKQFDETELVSNLVSTTRYILKGTDPAACETLRIGYLNGRDQGKIMGKRCGISQALSQKNWTWPLVQTRHPGIVVSGPERRRRRMFALAGYAMTGAPLHWSHL
jgi:hypothetical protein